MAGWLAGVAGWLWDLNGFTLYYKDLFHPFRYLSISGGLFLLLYSLWRKDPVFILGQIFGIFVYGRNLFLISREKRRGNA
ncbi:MAG: lipid-A-disaccharide synthase N-terminal domain-containing protein [Deltaproteobacteria bacterium]|nr:lipid-A-disaccharide synthase N-terminal domain-containing protein [Deltaproteobacteria bacterium]